MVATGQTTATSSQLPEAVVARANELYWSSEVSVNRLVSELGLSKGTLYDVVRPLSAGLSCPRDAADLAYPNRTARDRGFVSCPSCGFEDEEENVRARKEQGPKTGGPASPAERVQGRALSQPGDDLAFAQNTAVARLESFMVAGALLAGIGVGLILADFLRKR